MRPVFIECLVTVIMPDNSAPLSGPIRLYGRPNSPEGAAVRDFLDRSNLQVEWVAVADAEAYPRYLGTPRSDGQVLPILELGDGRRLPASSPEEVARELGGCTNPN